MKATSASPTEVASACCPDDESPLLTAQPGRDWLFSPWLTEEHAVVFDANSGDYWVVSASAGHIMRQLANGPLARRDIILAFSNDPAGRIDEGTATAILDGLLEQGLIVSVPA